MIFDKINKIKAENKFLLERNRSLELAVDNLKKENETLAKDFTKKYVYVIVSDGLNYTKIYQNGVELKRTESIRYEHSIDEKGPTMEVVLR